MTGKKVVVMIKAWLSQTHDRIRSFMHNNVIMQWDNVSKSILVMLLGGFDFLIWLIWLVYSYHVPTLSHWINAEHYPFFFSFYLIAFIVYILFALILYRYKTIPFIQQVFPYIAVAYFGTTMMATGFAIGISSPATIAGYISVVTVGLVLFERKIIYLTMLPATVLLLTLFILSATNNIVYAPIFSQALETGELFKNSYWVYSMIFLYIPIFFMSILLFEMMLIQWRNRERWINEVSRRDPLTGIYNRRNIGEFLKDLEIKKIPYAIILLDLDYFKRINDEYGHDAGDQVLMKVSEVLSIKALEEDCVGRYGGEEFMMILPNVSKSQAEFMAETSRRAIAESIIHTQDERQFNITASFGVAMSSPDAKKEDVIRMADQALYIAKQNGRNQVHLI